MPNVFTPALRALEQEINERTQTTTIRGDFIRFFEFMHKLKQLADESSSNIQALHTQCVALIENIYRYYPVVVEETPKESRLQQLSMLMPQAQDQRLHHPQLPGPLLPPAPRAHHLANLLAALLRMRNPQQHQREEQYQRARAQLAQAQDHAIDMTQVLHAQGIESDALAGLRSVIGGILIQGPVVGLQDGENRHYYAREELVTWLARSPVNPMSRQPLTVEELVDATEEYRAKVREVMIKALADKPETERNEIVSRLFDQFGWSRNAGAAAAARTYPR